MEYKDILNLIKSINKSELTEFKMKQGDFELVIRTDKYVKSGTTVVSSPPQVVQAPPTAQPVAPTPEVQSTAAHDDLTSKSQSDASSKNAPDESAAAQGLIEVKSPIVGTFYRAPSPDKAPYVKVGDQIEVGSVICIVEAMKLFNEIESEVSGKIVKVVVDDASPVEYDQVLFLVEPV
ncbi:MAG: acetyl-CoA carboxylase biotin carboxyl carrier protein [Saprospirales bacterium]|nr:MAG: acetyl-CoA carboxylase biotin carboxyl carrier protein [Saprospirales bacterium]